MRDIGSPGSKQSIRTPASDSARLWDRAAAVDKSRQRYPPAKGTCREEKLARIFSENLSMLKAYVSRSLHEQADIDDVIQEVFVRLLKSGDISRWEDSPKAFLRRVALNYIRDSYRRGKARRSEHHFSVHDFDCCPTDISPEIILHWQQQLTSLGQAISELRPKCRKIFMMHRSECKTYKEIGREFGMSHKTVENYMDEALKHCKSRVELLSGG